VLLFGPASGGIVSLTCLPVGRYVQNITEQLKKIKSRKMKLSGVLIKPILSEKANAQQDKLRRYAFKVAKKANKLEIKKAVEEFYGVTVVDVNTSTSPGKNKTRYTKAGFISGQKPSFKKAFITVAEGDTIDLYANI
jgi:large subunit ribosomal protein L23